MYEYVNGKEEIKIVKEVVENIIKAVQNSSLKEYFTFQFFPIGSGKTNLVTRNGNTGVFDLDYNLVIRKDKKGLLKQPGKIKELFLKAFNEVNPKFQFSHPQDSTSVITSKLVYDNKLYFSFDAAILHEGNNGNYYKIVHNKSTGLYYWNEIKDSLGYQTKINELKKAKKWNLVRKRYLQLKNIYLSDQKNIPSFSILIQAMNEIKGNK